MEHVSSQRCRLADGAELAYVVYGQDQLETGRRPIVLTSGMGSLKEDWERIIVPLAGRRTVLIYDYRGMGESTYSTREANDNITVEVMARDLVALVEHVGWKDVDILGFSMGGVVLQQLLLLSGRPLPFRVHHVLLTGTFCSALQRGPQPLQFGDLSGKPLTAEQKLAISIQMLDISLGPKWVARPENQERYKKWLSRAFKGRRGRTIMKQRKALAQIDFREQLAGVPTSVKILVIHGVEDLLVPFSSGAAILRSIPHARMVGIGTGRGQVPSYEFGHTWYEYFNVDVWIAVIEAFVDDEVTLCKL